MSVIWYRRSNENKFNLIFSNKSSEINRAPTIIETLTRSPAKPSVVCVCSASLSGIYPSLLRGFFITGHAVVSRLQLYLFIS